MKKFLFSVLFMLGSSVGMMAQDTLWVKFDNRFQANKFAVFKDVDSIELRVRDGSYAPIARCYSMNEPGGYYDYSLVNLFGSGLFPGTLMFHNPGRYVYRPSHLQTMDFMSESSQWCFRRSMESEHFIVFWEPGFGTDPTKAGSYSFNPSSVLASAEKVWNKYVDDLGFLNPLQSKTSKYKIEIFVHYQTDWMANGSGYDFMTGALNISPGAIGARGGHTVAHEIGHTFQYLVSCDLGQQHGFNYGYGDNASGGNGWWESCADWQAYKCFPERQFTDGEYFEGHLKYHHLNLLHEKWRYENCFIQDWWCMKHGQDFIGRLWRESNKPEDPVEAYKRLNHLSQSQFNDEQMEGYMRMATWDIDGVREAARLRIGQHVSHLHETGDGYWQVDADYCPQNYGYNIINLNNAPAGTVVKASFQGIAGASGYRSVKVDKAGWRYGFVAYTKDGRSVRGEVKSDREGEASLTIPENCSRLFFVVMGAPVEHWHHAWDDNESNDEQWPYRVKFENTNLSGSFGDYPDDYQCKDTTIYIDAQLKAENNYTSTIVNYDMEAVSKALGLSSKQLHAVGREATSNPRFVAVAPTGSYRTGTTTTTSSNTVFGHWFTSSGFVTDYNSSACIFAEFHPDSYTCNVGQYPNHLVPGTTYTISQAIQYKKYGKWYTARFVVRLKAL